MTSLLPFDLPIGDIVSQFTASFVANSTLRCRNVPGSPGFPSVAEWNSLNDSVSGHLSNIVPSAKFCQLLPAGYCTDAEWSSSMFRDTIPGAMMMPNWEQDYDATPPSLCFKNGTTCDQGDVPLLGVLAQSVGDVQAGVNFAREHDLRLAIKASGHDYLGRSTAKNSLLISTHLFQNITFHDNFTVGKQDLGSAVTVGSGVALNTLYKATKDQEKIFVGGTAAMVAPAGGYFQGAGHSALSPIFGLLADNTLEFHVVTADGQHRRVNNEENTDLFWAMRGGGAGSWGVVTSATFQTFPTFDAAVSIVLVSTATAQQMGDVAALHAKHIFDFGSAGQYFWVQTDPTSGVLTMGTYSYFPKTSVDDAQKMLDPWLNASAEIGATVTKVQIASVVINDALYMENDLFGIGTNLVLGSRLMPTSVYETQPEAIGTMYAKILGDAGLSATLLGHLVAGGKVSENANISNAVNPKWRTAKTHLIAVNYWQDSDPIEKVQAMKQNFKINQLPAMLTLAGSDSGAYSNEGDTLEENPALTYFGVHYPRLSEIKKQIDPTDLFIVNSGVGSERWDAKGLCQVEN